MSNNKKLNLFKNIIIYFKIFNYFKILNHLLYFKIFFPSLLFKNKQIKVLFFSFNFNKKN